MKRSLICVAILAPAMAILRFCPGLAGLWMESAALPLLNAMHRLSAALPFPLLEPLALLLLPGLLRRRSRALILAFMIGMYGLLWYPAYFAAPAPNCDAPADAEQLCLRLGIDPADVCAVGDNGNDVSMIANVGLGVAMANGMDEAKAVARVVTERTNDEDGLADFIERVLL